MSKKKEISIRSSAAEYLAFVAATGEQANSIEMRYLLLFPSSGTV